MPKPRDDDEAQGKLALEEPVNDPLEVSFKPVPSRRDPAIWVRKLAVFKQWPPSPETELRTISLRRGLNILWAESKNDRKQPRIGGHGAGKTTFCRFVRYILDEKHPGTTEFRQDFRRIHPDGWVLAEVMLRNEPWLVGKSLSDRGRHHFAIPGATLDHPFEASQPAGGYDDYTKALEQAALGGLQIRNLSGSRRSLKWVHLLAWLARDQEAHYANLLAWRDSASEPEGQDLSAVDRENLVRLVMGLVEEQEQDRLTKRAKAAADHTEKLEARVPLDYIRRRERATLGTALGKSLSDIFGGGDADVPDDPLLLQEVEAKAKALEAEAEGDIKEARLEDEETDAEQKVISKAGTAKFQRALCARIRADLRKLEGKPEELPTQPKPTQSSVEANAELAAVEKAIGELRGLCNRTKDEAKLLECPHYREPVADPKTEKAISKQEDRDDLAEAAKRREIQRLTAFLAEHTEKLATMESDEAEARRFLLKVKEFIAAERKRLGAPAAVAQGIRDALAAYQTACRESATLADELKTLETRKAELDKEIAGLAEAHREVVTDFALLFDSLAKELLGDEVKGTVHLGKGIEPDLTYHGRRKSAALNLSKLLAFDLACLALGMTSERAHHPRFIIHDSPRESDLAIGIYHALFDAARKLEEACDGEPAFQYIVTTTESPPDALNKAPWRLEPVLDASEPARRFLGVDLG